MYTPIELLIVDDNPGDVRLFQEFFKSTRLSNNVNYVRNTQQMLSFLQQDDQYQDAPSPDVILLDIRPFLLDSSCRLDTLKTHPRFKEIALVGLLGAAEEEQGLADRDVFSGYLVKPVDLEQLSAALMKINSLGLVISRVNAPASV